MKVCSLCGSSTGNAVLVSEGDDHYLIDAGMSARQITRLLDETGVRAEDISALILTHEHTDHIRGVGPFVRRYETPLYLNEGTLVSAAKKIGVIPAHLINEFETGRDFHLGSLRFHPFSIPHDAADPVGFVVQRGENKIGIATDLGYVTQLVRQKLSDCCILVLESNYDVRMLKSGPYPWSTKQRILSRHGHLSNDDAGGLLRDLLSENTIGIIGTHLSETNNHPDIVRRIFESVLEKESRRIEFQIARPKHPCKPIEAPLMKNILPIS